MNIPVHISRGGSLGRFLAIPASLLGTVLVYAQFTGLSIPLYALVYAAYLFAPALVLFLGRARRSRWVPLWGLVAISLFWLPIEFALLPASAGSTAGWLRRQPGRGHRCGILSVSRGVAAGRDRMHPGARRTGLPSGGRGVGGIRSRGSAARVAHGLFDLAPGGRRGRGSWRRRCSSIRSRPCQRSFSSAG